MELFLGVDIGKFKLDVHVKPLDQDVSIDNNESGLRTLVKMLKNYVKEGHEIKLVVCEATGGYERPLVNILSRHNISLHVAHANKVRNFAKAIGKFAKTDKVDAKILSDYAVACKPAADVDKLDSGLQDLKDLQIRRKQLLNDLIKEKSRLDKNISENLVKSIKRHIKWLEREIEIVDESIDEFINDNENLKSQVDLITSIPGVGKTTAVAVLTELPEMNTATDKQLSALVGVAPINRDSGTKNGKRYIHGGRMSVRNILYMAAISFIRCNHVIKDFYYKLRNKGKPAKVAIIAALHKLLLMIKSVVKRKSRWVSDITKLAKICEA